MSYMKEGHVSGPADLPDFVIEPQADCIGECEDHFHAIRWALVILLNALGREEDTSYQVRVSGHANPSHAPRDGWADEAITISVSVVPAKD